MIIQAEVELAYPCLPDKSVAAFVVKPVGLRL